MPIHRVCGFKKRQYTVFELFFVGINLFYLIIYAPLTRKLYWSVFLFFPLLIFVIFCIREIIIYKEISFRLDYKSFLHCSLLGYILFFKL